MQLRNKTAIITGAASGIGKSISLRFLEEGARVLLVDVNEKKLEELKKEFIEKNLNQLFFLPMCRIRILLMN